jgi:hypothetical protein
LKVISINKQGEGFQVFYEEAEEYVEVFIDIDSRQVERNIFPKAIYGDHERFWSIMGKFDSYTRFLIEPVEIKDITFNNVRKLYNELASKFRWKEE